MSGASANAPSAAGARFDWIGASYNATVYPLTLTICACGLASAAIASMWVRKDGDIDPV